MEGTKYQRLDGSVELQTNERIATEDTINEIRKQTRVFSGETYSKQMTMTTDAATRFEVATRRLRDCVIKVTSNAMLLGRESDVVYPKGVNGTVGFTQIDISTLYFKNATAGNNGVISILATEE